MSFIIETQETLSLTLPSPDFGDHELIDPQIIISETKVNTPIIIKSDDWPQQTIYTYPFTMIKEADIIVLKFILMSQCGKYVTITDHNNDEYDGFILNKSVIFITDKDETSYSFELKILKKET